jgi:lipoprotein-releasing system ATP-binding protein
MTEILLKARKISKKFFSPFSVEVLKQIDLEVHRGESIAIVGKSGEGKSTLLHILGTLETPSNGELEICGHKTASYPLAALRNQHIGFIFQTYNLLEDYTALENVLMPAKIARQPTHSQSAAYQRALMLLDAVGLKNRIHFPSKLLSGGEKQRTAIARALCNDPDLILADEPSGNLDSAHSQEIHSLLFQLCSEYKKSLIVVTHDREFSALCNRTLRLKDGILTH